MIIVTTKENNNPRLSKKGEFIMPIKFANTYVESYSYYPKAFRFISMMRYDFDKRDASEKYEIALLTTDEKSDSYEYTYFYGDKYIDEKPVTHIFDEYWIPEPVIWNRNDYGNGAAY